MLVVGVDPGWTMNIESDRLTLAAGDVIAHLTAVLSLVSVGHTVQLQCSLVSQDHRPVTSVVEPAVGGERVGFSVASQLHRVCLVHLVQHTLRLN